MNLKEIAMVSAKHIQQTVKLIFMAFLLFINCSCVKEEMSVCAGDEEQEETFLYLKVVDSSSGEDITNSGEVDIVDLFIFKPDGCFFEHITVSADSIMNGIPILIKGRSTKDLWVSAWGNLKGNQIVSAVTGDCKMSEMLITLNSCNEGYALSPDDLFFGIKQLSNATVTKASYQEHITISQKVARMNIIVKGLPLDISESDYFFTICDGSNGYSIEGEPINSYVEMRQFGKFHKETDNFITDAFNLVHAASGDHCMTINLHYNATNVTTKAQSIIVSATKDSDGNLIAPKAGKTTNILIDLTQGEEAIISMEITPWDEIYQWVVW